MNNSRSDFMVTSANYSDGPVRNDFHHHVDFEIIFVTEGTIEATICDKTYEVSKKHLLFISNLETHSIRQISRTYKRYWITLDAYACSNYIRDFDFLNFLKNHSADFCHCIDVAPLYDIFLPLFEKLMLCTPDALYSNELAACYIKELIIHIYRLEPQRVLNTDSTLKNRILNIQNYMDANYWQPIRMDEICKKFYISNSYLSHQFKAITGYSPRRYLTLIRLKHASIMIHDTDNPISEIALSCGFSDMNNFIKQFKQVYLCTPSEFRRLR